MTSQEGHNPLSGEDVGIHEKTKAEKAEDLGRSIEEYEETVFTLDDKDTESRKRLQRFVEHGQYYDVTSDRKARMIAEELLGNGSFDVKKYRDEEKKDDPYPYYRGQTTSHACGVIDFLLKDPNSADMPWIADNLKYDDIEIADAA